MQGPNRIIVLATLAIAAAGAGVAAGVWYTAGHDGATAATVLDAPRPLPDFSLVGERGEQVTRAGVRAVVKKPIDPPALLAILRQHLSATLRERAA